MSLLLSRSSGLVLLCAMMLSPEVGAAAERPNVIVILSDDQGWGDLSINGNTNLSTPHIDSLAEDGAMFDRFYVCPVCSPTRAEFLTGRYHSRSGVYSTSAGGERMDLDERTIADDFKAAGYTTAAFGKWHNGMQYPYHPNGRGFDEYYGFCSGHWGHYFSPLLEHNGQLTRGQGFCIDDFTNHAIDFMDVAKKKGKPFLIYLPYNTPHSPMQVPDRFWNKFANHPMPMRHREPKREQLGHSRAALAMCENIDWNVGRLLSALRERKIEKDTIVIYFCDNGPNGSRWNGGMKGRKGSTDEGGVRSPLHVRWPGHIEPGTKVSTAGAAIDLYPTLAGLCDVPVQSEKPLDGMNLEQQLRGEQESEPVRTLFHSWRGRVSAHRGSFILDNDGKLFDLKTDPGQHTDISARKPAITKSLSEEVANFRKTVLSELPEKDERPFVIGHPDFKWTQVPARDGIASGKIQRSNKFPNCSYFTNWIRAEDTIEWPVEVLADGTFEVTVHYACPPDDVGSTIAIACQGQMTSAKLTEPQTSPLIGAEEDRVKRAESYVKNFAPLSLGELKLKKGPGRLVLSADDVPGSQVMEFRLLMLQRVED